MAAADAEDEGSGFQRSIGFWFDQPSDAAALAAAPSGANPDDGKLGKLRGSAYLIRPVLFWTGKERASQHSVWSR